MLYPADPPTVEEIVSVMRHVSEDRHGWRLRAVIVMLWRGWLRVQVTLSLSERDLDPRRGSVLVRHGKGGRRREVGMDAWGWEHVRPWSQSASRCRWAHCSGHRRPHPWATLVKRRSPRRVSPTATLVAVGWLLARRRAARRAGWMAGRSALNTAGR